MVRDECAMMVLRDSPYGHFSLMEGDVAVLVHDVLALAVYGGLESGILHLFLLGFLRLRLKVILLLLQPGLHLRIVHLAAPRLPDLLAHTLLPLAQLLPFFLLLLLLPLLFLFLLSLSLLPLLLRQFICAHVYWLVVGY